MTDSFSFKNARINPGRTRLGQTISGGLFLGLAASSAPIFPFTAATMAAESTAPSANIEEIIVTARKREEALHAVPEAVSVLSRDDLQRFGFRTSPEIAQQTPNLMWHSILGFATPHVFLRGIGNATFNANQASPVGIHLDNAYQGSSLTYGFGLMDLERVEILKGPQGTLFGRNTTGGVVNFISRKPDPAAGFNGEVTATYGRFDEANLEAAVGVPLTDKVAVRVSGLLLNRDGYVTNANPASGFDREGALDIWSARGQMRFMANGGFDALFTVHGGQNQSDAAPGKQIGILCPAGVDVPRLGQCSDFFGFTDTVNLRETFTNTQSYDKVNAWGASATLTWPLNGFTIVSQTSYDANDRQLVDDSDASPLSALTTNVVSDFYQISQEVRLASNTEGPLVWVAGGNFYKDNFTSFQTYALNAFGPGGLTGFFPVEEGIAASLTQKTESYALFGEASYEITPRLTLTAGVRWTRDQRTGLPNAYFFDATGLTAEFIRKEVADARLLLQTIPQTTVENSWSKWSGRGALSYEVVDDWFVYAGIARGFKGGDFNGGALFDPSEANLVNPELVTSYEIGTKGQSRDLRYTFDVSGFYYDFSDQQVGIFIPGSNATLQHLSNAAKTTVLGFEAAATVRPLDSLFMELKVGVLDAEFKRFQLDPNDPATNYAGNRTASSPKFSMAGTGRYTVPVRYGDFGAQVDFSYTGSHFFSVDNNPTLFEDGYWLLNGNLSFEDKEGRYRLSAWVKNIADEDYFVSGISNTASGFMELFPGLPRTFGLTITGRF